MHPISPKHGSGKISKYILIKEHFILIYMLVGLYLCLKQHLGGVQVQMSPPGRIGRYNFIIGLINRKSK